MIEMGKALTEDDTYGLMIPSTGYPYWMFQALAIQNGKEVMSGDGLTTYFDDPTVVRNAGILEIAVDRTRHHADGHRRVGHIASGVP